MDAIGPGDFVECISEDMDDGLRFGAVYQVTEIMAEDHYPCNCHFRIGQGGLRLKELPTREDQAWCVYNFRPIYRPKSEFIESLKIPLDAEILENV